MASTAQHLSHPPSRFWSIFYRSPLLLKIATWVCAIDLIVTMGLIVADLHPIIVPQVELPGLNLAATPLSIDPDAGSTKDDLGVVNPLFSTSTPSPASSATRSNSPLLGSIIHPQHSNLLTADNYTVSVNGANLGSKIVGKSSDIHLPNRSREIITTTKSNVQPTSSKSKRSSDRYRSVPTVPKLPLPKSIVPSIESTGSIPTHSTSTQLAGIKSTIVTPMKPPLRAKRSKSSAEVTPVITPPIMLVKARLNEGIFKDVAEIYDEEEFEKIANTLDLKFDPANLEEDSEQDDKEQAEIDDKEPKLKILLSKNTEIVVGVSELNATDFTDSISPLFDRDEETGVSEFAKHSGVYSLVGGSGAGLHHQFNSNLEGSIGILFRSSGDSLTDENRGDIIKEKINNRSLSRRIDNIPLNSLASGSINDRYSTIAQLTYHPNQDTKVGLTYVYGYKIESGIGSDLTDDTEGIDNAVSLQAAWRVDPNLTLGGSIGLDRNTNPELNKNILTWAITAAIPNVAGTGNSAGIAIGQEPGVISSSDLEVENIAPAWHLECFYKIKVGDDFSIVPSIIYLNRPNQDLSNSNPSDTIGFIRAKLEF